MGLLESEISQGLRSPRRLGLVGLVPEAANQEAADRVSSPPKREV